MNHELDFPAGIWEPFARSRPPVRCSAGGEIKFVVHTFLTAAFTMSSSGV